MKLWSKEALVLGGIYGILSTPFAYSNNEIAEKFATGLFCLFILNVLILCFNKTPRFISWAINHYPRLSYYLSSIGWIPYFAIIIPVLFLASAFFINYSDKSLSFCVDILHYILELGIPVSLAIAFIRQRFKKN